MPNADERKRLMGLPCGEEPDSICGIGYASVEAGKPSDDLPRASTSDLAILIDKFVREFQKSPGAALRISLINREESDQEAAQLFLRFYADWNRDTANISNVTKIITHPAYLHIISLGKRALKHILESLQEGRGPWLVALEAIVYDDCPVPPEHRNSVQKMQEDWLEWGRRNGYLESQSGFTVTNALVCSSI
jgi:hypothetical protein